MACLSLVVQVMCVFHVYALVCFDHIVERQMYHMYNRYDVFVVCFARLNARRDTLASIDIVIVSSLLLLIYSCWLSVLETTVQNVGWNDLMMVT